ncbi:hypothetical protein EV361DRAFT_962959 [Lentinula raphanica]|nr:hypothetical protein FB446DRAFT_785586 [Lentinula raphanica]KAJ3817813.1 hypothetical protein F5880DRAFT_1332028 [Lentinula raphanica]KAJ3970974.1 hypothetical protein EV361DRAFT_962959 [Lentinula raphanica]
MPATTKKDEYSEEEHLSLLPDESTASLDYEKQGINKNIPRPAGHILLKAAAILGVFIFASVVLILSVHVKPQTCAFQQFPEGAYSPAHGSVSYVTKRFNGSFPMTLTEYQGEPSPELDEKWEQLYAYAISQIPREEAMKLTDKTVPIPGDESNYIVGLEVFHQLHCLDSIRKSLRPDYYPSMPNFHTSHCVDIIRQALMCTVDISPIVWEWREKEQVSDGRLDAMHTCRNWDQILEWGKEHQIQTHFDIKTKAVDILAE